MYRRLLTDLTVSHQRVEITGGIVDSCPKTEAGRRIVALDGDTSQALTVHRLVGLFLARR